MYLSPSSGPREESESRSAPLDQRGGALAEVRAGGELLEKGHRLADRTARIAVEEIPQSWSIPRRLPVGLTPAVEGRDQAVPGT
ncbi:MAG: hypothetical protein U5K30_12650 [Acidimicrobiales bacterium]|nr:hypothetical protein [Acidimicrobiales bacterium]